MCSRSTKPVALVGYDKYLTIAAGCRASRRPPFIPVTGGTRGTEASRASAGEPSCRSRHRSGASAAPRSALPRLRTRLAGSANGAAANRLGAPWTRGLAR